MASRCGFIASVRHCYAHVTLCEMKFVKGVINYLTNEDIKTEGQNFLLLKVLAPSDRKYASRTYFVQLDKRKIFLRSGE